MITADFNAHGVARLRARHVSPANGTTPHWVTIELSDRKGVVVSTITLWIDHDNAAPHLQAALLAQAINDAQSRYEAHLAQGRA